MKKASKRLFLFVRAFGGGLVPILVAVVALSLGGCCGGFVHLEPIPSVPHRIVITNVGVVYEPIVGSYDRYDPCIVYLERTGNILVTEHQPTYLGTVPPQCYNYGGYGYGGAYGNRGTPGVPFVSQTYRGRHYGR